MVYISHAARVIRGDLALWPPWDPYSTFTQAFKDKQFLPGKSGNVELNASPYNDSMAQKNQLRSEDS